MGLLEKARKYRKDAGSEPARPLPGTWRILSADKDDAPDAGRAETSGNGQSSAASNRDDKI